MKQIFVYLFILFSLFSTSLAKIQRAASKPLKNLKEKQATTK